MNTPRSSPLAIFMFLFFLLGTCPALGQPLLQAGEKSPLPSLGDVGNHTAAISIADNGQLATLYYQNEPEVFAYNGNGSLLWNITLAAEQVPWVSSASSAPDGSVVSVTQLIPGCCHGTVTNTSSNKVILFDRAGAKEWEYPTASPPLSSVISGNNRDILIGTEDGRIIDLDRNGTLCWTARVDAPVLSLATSRDGSTIVATGDSHYAFNKTYGEPLSPHDLFALSENGTLLWDYQTKGWNSAAVSDDGSAIAAIEKVSGTLRIFNRAGPVTTLRVYPGGLAALALAGDGSLIITQTPGGGVYGFTGNGSPVWTLPAEPGSRGLAITGTEDSVMIGDGSTLRWYSRDGTEIANRSLDGTVQSVAAAPGTGVIVAVTERSLFFFSHENPAPGTGISGLNVSVTVQSPVASPASSQMAPVDLLVPVTALLVSVLGIAGMKRTK